MRELVYVNYYGPWMACSIPLCMDLTTPFSSSMSYKFLPMLGPSHHLTCLSTSSSAEDTSSSWEYTSSRLGSSTMRGMENLMSTTSWRRQSSIPDDLWVDKIVSNHTTQHILIIVVGPGTCANALFALSPRPVLVSSAELTYFGEMQGFQSWIVFPLPPHALALQQVNPLSQASQEH